MTTPNPLITSISIDDTDTVTCVALGGPTDLGLMTTWWEIALETGVTIRINETSGQSYSIQSERTDVWIVPPESLFQGLSLCFAMQPSSGGSIYRSPSEILFDPRFNHEPAYQPPGPPLIPNAGAGTQSPGVYKPDFRDNSLRQP